jgi:hypothetical protein
MEAIFPPLIVMSVIALIMYVFTAWAERKNPAWGSVIPIAFVSVAFFGILKFAAPKADGFLQLALILILINAVVAFRAFSRKPSLPQKPYHQAPSMPQVRSSTNDIDNDLHGYPQDYFGEIERQNQRDAQESYDQKMREESSNERREEREEESRRADED